MPIGVAFHVAHYALFKSADILDAAGQFEQRAVLGGTDPLVPSPKSRKTGSLLSCQHRAPAALLLRCAGPSVLLNGCASRPDVAARSNGRESTLIRCRVGPLRYAIDVTLEKPEAVHEG